MKLNCKVLAIPLRVQTKGAKPSKAILCIRKGKLKSANGIVYQLTVSTVKARNQDGITLNRENITNIISTHIAAGKVTIDFACPSIRVFISEANSDQLNRFIEIVKKLKNNEDPGNIEKIDKIKSTEIPASTNLKVDNNKHYHTDFAGSFPSNLLTIYITNCALQRIDTRWFASVQLNTLSLANNQLGSIPSELRKFCLLRRLRSLQKLDLSYNRLTFLPDDIAFPDGLIYLNLSNNLFKKSVPQCTTHAMNLVHLDLSFNELTELPNELAWPHLKYLSINNTMITCIPHYLTRICLEKLYYSGRPLDACVLSFPGLSVIPPSLEHWAAAVVRQHRLPIYVLPWTISVASLAKKCDYCFNYFPTSWMHVKLEAVNIHKIAASSDSLQDILVRVTKCNNCLFV